MQQARQKKSEAGRLADLEKRIGYRFASREILERALTHSSLRASSADDFHYERLEFLGDRVLALVVADLLHHNFPEASEGELSVRMNSLVKGGTLAEISDALHLHEFIRSGAGSRQLRGKRMQSVRADVLEALIASIYLDGGLSAARAFIERFWDERLHHAGATRRDPKTELQEWAHANRLETPQYVELARSGPDHDPEFTISVRITGIAESQGKGRSKRLAEQAAARAMLAREGVIDPTEER